VCPYANQHMQAHVEDAPTFLPIIIVPTLELLNISVYLCIILSTHVYINAVSANTFLMSNLAYIIDTI
jgi:hypothetical protein